jgi:hypothetical protein
MVILFVATGVVVAAVAALALKSWVLLFAVLGLHAVARERREAAMRS